MTEKYRDPTHTLQRPKQINLGVTNSGCDRGTKPAPKDPRPSSGCTGTDMHMVHAHTQNHGDHYPCLSKAGLLRPQQDKALGNGAFIKSHLRISIITSLSLFSFEILITRQAGHEVDSGVFTAVGFEPALSQRPHWFHLPHHTQAFSKPIAQIRNDPP